MAVIGESGCGKSTLLALIYGLLQPSSGTIHWHNHQVLGPDYNLVPGEPMMKYVAQDFDLMPYTTVAENIGKFLSNFFPEEKQEKTKELLSLIDMTAFANVKVKQLSGGQKQRVALARALAKEPEVLLLDEPFSNIDNFRKNKLRRNLFQYLKSKKITCLIATHDSTDILSYTDRTLVLKNGEIIANEVTEELFRNPSTPYVGSLFGEINQLSIQYFKITKSTDVVLIYPFELVPLATNTADQKAINLTLTVQVKNSYFETNHYLIKASVLESSLNKTAVMPTKELFFESKSQLALNTTLKLIVPSELLKTRIFAGTE